MIAFCARMLCVWLCFIGAAHAQAVVVYADALQNGFENYSFGGGSNFANATPTHLGSAASISLAGNNFNALSFAQPPAGADYAVAQYPVLHLWVHGGTSGGQQLRLYLQLNDAIVGPPGGVELDSSIAGGAIVAGQWREVLVRLDLPPVSYAGSYDRIDLQSDVVGTQPTLYIDDVTIGPAQTIDELFADGFESAVAAGILRFSAATYSVAENGVQATITVQRTVGASGAVAVTYATADGTATQPGDYASAGGQLSWNAGESADKTFTVAIVNDVIDESNETVALALSAPTGGATLGAPSSAVLTILDDDDPVAANALLVETDVTTDPDIVGGYGCTGDRFTWRDSTNSARVAFLAHNTGQSCPGGSRGGELRVLKYQTPGGTRIVRAAATGASGFGYAVSHRNEGTTGIAFDDSPLGHGFTGSFQRVYAGRHHAIFRFTQNYPRYSRTNANPPNTTYQVPVTLQWVFATGRDHPLWSVTWDASAVPADALNDDSRAPYGELLFDGSATQGAHAVIAGVAWGDRYEFTTTGGPASYGSAWTWNVPNTIPYVKLWTTAPDATMGTVLTQTIQQQDAGGYFGTSRWNSTSAAGNACTVAIGGVAHLMPCDFNWPYQSINYSLSPFNPAQQTNNTRLAWGTNFGFLGQQNYFVHGSAFWGGPLQNQTAIGWPRTSYSAFVVLDRNTLDPVGAQVEQVETTQATTASTLIGTVAASGPAGANRPDNITYAPSGYDPVYSAWTFSATANALDANLAVGAGRTLRKPLVIVRNWTQAGAPSLVRLNGAPLAADAGYFGSVRVATQELWLTINADLAGANNRIQVDP